MVGQFYSAIPVPELPEERLDPLLQLPRRSTSPLPIPAASPLTVVIPESISQTHINLRVSESVFQET